MTFEELDIAGVYLITPQFIGDDRGGFFRYYCREEFAAITTSEFVQMNHSINHQKGTLRGLHYQLPPHSEEKVVRCIHGSIQDVFVDLRAGSPTFLKWSSVQLSAANRKILFLPKGIAHGFITLEDHTELLYQHSAYYAPDFERGIHFSDPRLNIQWELEASVVSDRDRSHPTLDEHFNGLIL